MTTDKMDTQDQLKVAIEEYRFQVQFNWSRTQYLFALNVGILIAGTVVATGNGSSAALVYLLGLFIAVLTSLAARTMHQYYRNTRDRVKELEQAAGVDGLINSTTSFGGRNRDVSVADVITWTLWLIAAADMVGFALMTARFASAHLLT